MAKRSLTEQLDEAVEALLTARRPGHGGAGAPDLKAGVDPRLGPLLTIAADLVDLPRGPFKARLKTELSPAMLSAPDAGSSDAPNGPGSGEPPALSRGTRAAKGSAARRQMLPHDLNSALAKLPDATQRVLSSLDQSAIGVARLSTQREMWERHLNGDELLHVLDGEIDITTLASGGPVQTRAPAGSIFVSPRGLWRSLRPQPAASVLFVKPEEGNEHSRAKDPRRRRTGTAPEGDSGGTARTGHRTGSDKPARLAAQDVRAALAGAPELVLSENTTAEEAEAAFRQLGAINQTGIFVGRFSGLAPWERHTAGDELLHVLEGEVEIEVLAEAGPFRTTLRAGSVFVCPRGLWHRQFAAKSVTLLSATPQPTDVSFAADPRL